uniref:E1 domain-containing protein n=1 Tax=Timema tahoe TaxID=61484 RepID=A0A7R9NVS0_9NEOP|nr:unnamed protein product [Timema tahoe]
MDDIWKRVKSSVPDSNSDKRAGRICLAGRMWPAVQGPFQSDALLVPENCLFDHIHNQTKCWQFDRWNGTAAQSCQERDLTLRSFAMLLPCGISLFSGVEFVCCPKHFKATRLTVFCQNDVLRDDVVRVQYPPLTDVIRIIIPASRNSSLTKTITRSG